MKLTSKIKEVWDKVFPGYEFWNNFVEKLFSFCVSFKVWVVVLASVFRVLDYVDGATWATTIVSITLGRVVVQGVVEAKKSKDSGVTIDSVQFEKLIKGMPKGE